MLVKIAFDLIFFCYKLNSKLLFNKKKVDNRTNVQILISARSHFAPHGRPSDQRTILYFFTLIETIYMMYK